MTDVPFGFGPHQDDDEPGSGGSGRGGSGDLPDFGGLLGLFRAAVVGDVSGEQQQVGVVADVFVARAQL